MPMSVPASAATEIRTAIITVSDRASRGEYDDESGPALAAACAGRGWLVAVRILVPDDRRRIQKAIRTAAAQGCGLVLTTGGTGIADSDVTPEAIRGIMRMEIPGFGEIMRSRSMEITPNAILSRSLAALVDHCLVVALPGNPAGAVQCLEFVSAAIPHAVRLASHQPWAKSRCAPH